MKGILDGKFIAKASITEDKLSDEVINKLNEEPPTIEIVQNTGNNTEVVMSQKAVTDALSMKANTSDIPTDYVPNVRTINGKALNANINLTATDVGAATTSDIPAVTQATGTSTASVMSQKAVTDALNTKANSSDIPTDYVTTSALNTSLTNYVPTSRTINGKALNANITLSASEIGAAKTSDIPPVSQTTGTSTASVMSQKAVTDALNTKANTSDIPTDYITTSTLNTSLTNYVPTTRTINGKALNANITLSASEIGAAKTSDIPKVVDQLGESSTDAISQKAATNELNNKANISQLDSYLKKIEIYSNTAVLLGSDVVFDWSLVQSGEEDYLPVFVGTSAKQRRIRCVKEGLHDWDVATVGQLNTALSSKANLSDIPTNYVPTTRTINGKALSGNVTLTATDVGAATTSAIPTVTSSLGSSTTSVMSQSGVTSALYNDPSTRYRVQIGYNTSSTGTNSVALGNTVTTTGNFAVGLGVNAKAAGDYSTAVGPNPTASGLHAVAVGYSANATGDYSIALGRLASVTEEKSTAIGYRAKVHADDILNSDYNLGIISFGDSQLGDIKRIINVREGKNAHDVATFNQVSSTRSASMELMNELLEVIELMSVQPVADNLVRTTSTNTLLSDKLSSLKSKVKKEIDEIKDWEQEQEQYYASIQKNAEEDINMIN